MRSEAASILSALGLACALLLASPSAAKVFYSQEEAIELAFPDAERVDKETYVLDDDQVEAIQALSHAEVDSRLVSVYTGYREGRLLGYAMIDVHTVRTQPEAFLVVISPGGEVQSLRVLAFYEPPEYLPPERWLRQFDARRLSEDLALQGEIHGIAGSTLSARAVTGGVRRALALYEVVLEPRRQAERSAPAEGAAPAGM